MANYRKSFNFRNGVQVDYDNFIVNTNGLVGIGTSIPTEFLDVRGNAKVIGLFTATSVSAQNLSVSGVTTFTSLDNGRILINSGIITASSGVVTYYGDGSKLTNLASSQWVDVNPGTGFSSIYNSGTVGIATSMPNYFLQIGNDPQNSSGTGISSTGNIRASGVITAASFDGSGAQITQINASNISSGTLSNSRLPSSINISGIITAPSFNGTLNGNVNSGVGTFNNVVIGGATTSLIVNGNSRINGVVTAITFVGNLTGTASTAQSLTGTPNITVGSITASSIGVGLVTSGITTSFSTLHVGTGGTAFAALNSGRIGIGTALPTSDLQIRKTSSTLFEVISSSEDSRISIGQSVGVGRSTAVLRFGNISKTFDILNNDTGNFNLYLHAGAAGIGTGRFAWIYGQTNTELASLTYDGKLGIGKTNPDNTIHVVGTSTVTGNAWFGNNVTISGNLSVGSIDLPSVINDTNLFNLSGISTVYDLRVTNSFIVPTGSKIGVGTDTPITSFDARGQNGLFGSIGIGTTSFNQSLRVNGLSLLSSVAIGNTNLDDGSGVAIVGGTTTLNSNSVSGINSSIVILDDTCALGVGTTSYRSAVDFADAGKNHYGGVGAFMVVPRLTNSQRTGLSTVGGAIIFNTDTGKFQGYTGIAWTDFH